MIPFANFDNARRILCLGAHSDDIEIGAGGALLRLLEDHPHLEIIWIVFSGDSVRKEEAVGSANAFLKNAKKRHIETHEFRDGFFPYSGDEIKSVFESLKQRFSPDIVFTHFLRDRHQDHRIISELTWNTFRNHLILEYEIPKYEGDLGHPNFFLSLEEKHCSRKTSLLMNHFNSQLGKSWFSEETFRSLLRIRGIESNSPSGYAEAFHCRKFLF